MDILNKINRVVASCKTEHQLKNAVKYILLAEKSGKISSARVVYWGGVINGIAHANNWK